MTVFLDTSALVAVLDASEPVHAQAAAAWVALLRDGAALLTSNYVLLETAALVQRRFGLPTLLRLERDLRPLLKVIWVDATTHDTAVSRLLDARRRDLSLVDCVSLTIMQREGIRYAFAFDRHFREYGYCLPPTVEPETDPRVEG